MLGREVYLVGSQRIPFCRSYTGYSDQSNLQLLTGALNGLVEQYQLQGMHIDEVCAGAVVVHSTDWNLAREAVLNTQLAPSTVGTTLQMACGTSLQGALLLAGKIASGQIDCAIAAGVDSISDAPLSVSKRLAGRLVKASRARRIGQKLAAFKGFSLGELAPVPPSTNEPRTGLSMGQHCELMAKHWGIERTDQDAWAMASHKKAQSAWASGHLDTLVTPHNGVTYDNNIRPDISAVDMAKLKPAFDRKAGSLTAGNSTPLTDGAGALLLATREWAEARGLPVLARITAGRTAANNFAAGDGLLMASTQAVADLLKQTNLALQDFDSYEIHEAFAAQVLCTLRAWEDAEFCQTLGADGALGSIDRDRINPWGSSLAVGHPFAATGARVMGVAGEWLAQQGSGRTLISVCTAGGMGVAAILERT